MTKLYGEKLTLTPEPQDPLSHGRGGQRGARGDAGLYGDVRASFGPCALAGVHLRPVEAGRRRIDNEEDVAGRSGDVIPGRVHRGGIL